jgi:TDG/mug DNA glycosylase family protein
VIQTEDKILTAFPPIVNAHSRLLILGSMPSVESLKKRQYYAHPQNAFWRILFDLWDVPYTTDYPVKTEFILSHQLALWDVLAKCHRKGSADTEIRAAEANDFSRFFHDWPNIKWIVFNGQTAFKLFERLVSCADKSGKATFQLGSTSPAHAVPYAARLAEWKRIRDLLTEGG